MQHFHVIRDKSFSPYLIQTQNPRNSLIKPYRIYIYDTNFFHRFDATRIRRRHTFINALTVPFVVLPSEVYTYSTVFISVKRHSRVSTRFHAIYLADCYHVDSAATHRPVRNGRQGRELG